MVKLRVKEPLRNERGEVVGSSNYGIYSAGEVFILSDEEAQRELTVCGHAIERYAEWEDRQRTERAKQVYTRQQAEDFARHQAELKQLSLAEVELRKQAASKHLHLSESESYSVTFDPEKEELRRKLEEKEKLLAELTAKKGPSRKEKRATLPSMQKNTSLKEMLAEEFLPDEEV